MIASAEHVMFIEDCEICQSVAVAINCTDPKDNLIIVTYKCSNNHQFVITAYIPVKTNKATQIE